MCGIQNPSFPLRNGNNGFCSRGVKVRTEHFENLINNEGLTTFHKAGTAFYLLKLKIESQGLFDQGYFLCYKYLNDIIVSQLEHNSEYL